MKHEICSRKLSHRAGRSISSLISLKHRVETAMMYITPIVYPLSQLGKGTMRTILLINPVTAPVELFRLAVLGQGTINCLFLGISAAVTVLVALIGIMIFNRVEKTFMDTV